jgi:hypothetical protein
MMSWMAIEVTPVGYVTVCCQVSGEFGGQGLSLLFTQGKKLKSVKIGQGE